MIRLNQIAVLEQVKGVEPSYRAWEARVLPMNYTCEFLVYYIISEETLQEKIFAEIGHRFVRTIIEEELKSTPLDKDIVNR